MKRYVCDFCGEDFGSLHPALLVECPRCKAKEGCGCKRPSDHSGNFVAPHLEREELAVNLGVLGMCSEGPTAKAKTAARQEVLF